jgi:hypothetical protein
MPSVFASLFFLILFLNHLGGWGESHHHTHFTEGKTKIKFKVATREPKPPPGSSGPYRSSHPPGAPSFQPSQPQVARGSLSLGSDS